MIRILHPDGIEASAGADGLFELTAPPGKLVIVHGYHKEPYLKFSAGKVYANDRAPTTYVNREKAPPADAKPQAAPRWVEQQDGLTYAWHDHRTHWMASQPPAVVQRNRRARHHILDWTVDGTVNGERFAVEGSLDWVPAKNGVGFQWISYIAIGGFISYLGFILVTRLARRRCLFSRQY